VPGQPEHLEPELLATGYESMLKDTPPRRSNRFMEYAARNQWVWLVVGGVAAVASVIGAIWSFTSGHPVVALFITFAVSFVAFGAFIAWSDRG
jgi:hypothetical protein